MLHLRVGTAILHDVADLPQGVTGRPGARFGPSGIRRGSQRIESEAAWSIYTGMKHVQYTIYGLMSLDIVM
jgi:arginase family enzyme